MYKLSEEEKREILINNIVEKSMADSTLNPSEDGLDLLHFAERNYDLEPIEYEQGIYFETLFSDTYESNENTLYIELTTGKEVRLVDLTISMLVQIVQRLSINEY